jgi:hypothetical protein
MSWLFLASVQMLSLELPWPCRPTIAVPVLGDQQDAGNDHVHAVVELEPLQDVVALVLPRQDLDLRGVGPRRHLAQEFQQRRAGLGPVDVLPALEVRGQRPLGDLHFPKLFRDVRPRLALRLAALGLLRRDADLGGQR